MGGSQEGSNSRPSTTNRYTIFVLIVAPPLEVSTQYLPVLGKIAQFAKEEDVPDLLAGLEGPEDFLELLEERAT